MGKNKNFDYFSPGKLLLQHILEGYFISGKIDEFDFLKMLKDEGVIVGGVVMDSQRFIKRCYMLGFKPSQFKVWF